MISLKDAINLDYKCEQKLCLTLVHGIFDDYQDDFTSMVDCDIYRKDLENNPEQYKEVLSIVNNMTIKYKDKTPKVLIGENKKDHCIAHIQTTINVPNKQDGPNFYTVKKHLESMYGNLEHRGWICDDNWVFVGEKYLTKSQLEYLSIPLGEDA